MIFCSGVAYYFFVPAQSQNSAQVKTVEYYLNHLEEMEERVQWCRNNGYVVASPNSDLERDCQNASRAKIEQAFKFTKDPPSAPVDRRIKLP
jgi:hypothetical protein